MGAPLGYFSEDDVKDFPELNKCPDCETFFADLTCPLCGKTCPEEMRAGNRKPVKVKKCRRQGNGSGRVQFVPWYLSTWFIILMLFVQPIVGLVLLWMGYWKKHWKILVTVLLVLSYVGSLLFGGLSALLGLFSDGGELPVNADISPAKYMALCEEIDIETLYREANGRVDEYVTITLVVDGVWENDYDYDSEYPLYYQCHAEQNGRNWEFLVRDYRQEDGINLAVGDVVTIYGQVAGKFSISNYTAGTLTAPGINMLYLELISD